MFEILLKFIRDILEEANPEVRFQYEWLKYTEPSITQVHRIMMKTVDETPEKDGIKASLFQIKIRRRSGRRSGIEISTISTEMYHELFKRTNNFRHLVMDIIEDISTNADIVNNHIMNRSYDVYRSIHIKNRVHDIEKYLKQVYLKLLEYDRDTLVFIAKGI